MEYRNPKPTVDIFIVLNDTDLVLIGRNKFPLGVALPGGYVEEGESFEAAAIREAKEETGLDVELIEQFFTYSDPARDPRQHNVTTVYIARAYGELDDKSHDDAMYVFSRRLDRISTSEDLDFVFDHKLIIQDILRYVTTKERRKLPRYR